MPAPRDHSPEEAEQARQLPQLALTRADLEKLERELIALLHNVRRQLGKKPVHIPKE